MKDRLSEIRERLEQAKTSGSVVEYVRNGVAGESELFLVSDVAWLLSELDRSQQALSEILALHKSWEKMVAVLNCEPNKSKGEQLYILAFQTCIDDLGKALARIEGG